MPLDTSKLDVAIKRAIYAYRSAVEQDIRQSYYSKLNIDHLLLVIQESPFAQEYLAEIADLFKAPKNANLQSTLCSLAHNNYDIDKVAAELFQHPNTIRYRENRIKELLRIDTEWEFQMLCTLLVSKLK